MQSLGCQDPHISPLLLGPFAFQVVHECLLWENINPRMQKAKVSGMYGFQASMEGAGDKQGLKIKRGRESFTTACIPRKNNLFYNQELSSLN